MPEHQDWKQESAIISSSAALDQLTCGFSQMARLMALTLGPTQGVVINARNGRGEPERLMDAALIARRVVQFPSPGQDAGAMLLRGMVLDLSNRYGDGAATASVLAEAMARRGARLLAAGANPMSLARGMERAVSAVLVGLKGQAHALVGQPAIARLASLSAGDPELGELLGEMFEVLGPDAAVMIEQYHAPYLEREYLSGGRWTGRPAAREFLPPGRPEGNLENAFILVANQEFESVEQVQPALEMVAARRPRQPLVIFGRGMKGPALTTLLLNTSAGTINAIGLIPAGNLFQVEGDLADIALLTGARMIDPHAGDSLERIRLSDLGSAQRVRFTRDEITIAGGMGIQAATRQRAAELRKRARQLPRADPQGEKLRLRAARIAGGVGVLKIGATFENERELRVEAARKAMRVVGSALDAGVLSGGGVAFINCQPAARAAKSGCADEDEFYGVDLVASALDAPFRQIVANAGRTSPALALEHAAQLGPGFGLDVMTGQYVHMESSGILDSADILQGALQAAASAASMLLTTAAIVHRNEG